MRQDNATWSFSDLHFATNLWLSFIVYSLCFYFSENIMNLSHIKNSVTHLICLFLSSDRFEGTSVSAGFAFDPCLASLHTYLGGMLPYWFILQVFVMRILFLEFWCILNLVLFDLYLAEVEDTRSRMAFLDGGALLTLPLFYLEGIY